MKKWMTIALALILLVTAAGCRCEDPIPSGAWDDEDPPAPEKPVIYLYPEERQPVTVKLELQGQLTCTYPRYENGWTVTADPDGTLTDRHGQQYNYLYWEGITENRFSLDEGWCIEGQHTVAFLEDILPKLGLNRKEANEFIVYWLPQMERNHYNLICFQQEAYTDVAKLEISPEPDTLIRVFMTWQPSDDYVNLKEPTLSTPERTGFTAVEWGGAKIRMP